MQHVDSFADQLFRYLTNSELNSTGALIKRHTNDLSLRGEFSFPWKPEPWKKHAELRFSSPDELCDSLVQISQDWPTPISKCVKIDDRIHVFFKRTECIKRYFNRKPRLINDSRSTVLIVAQEGPEDDLTHYRASLLRDFAVESARALGYRHTNEKADYNIRIVSKSSNKTDNYTVLCGPVCNVKTGSKETQLTLQTYSTRRTIDMKLKAQHKYRVTVFDEDKWNESLESLGKSCVRFEMLEVKPSSSIVINPNDGGTSCSKGASFVLYNCARLFNIIRKFEANVRNGVHPPPPSLDQIDFNLLDDEDEWLLMFNYVLVYDNVLREIFRIERDSCIIAPHRLCSFLSSLVGKFSVYYRRVRVLLEPREHLLPKMYARIYLLRSLSDILTEALSILGITVLTEM